MNTYLPKLLITGSNGQVAQALLHHPMVNQFCIGAYVRSELDITQPHSIEKMFDIFKPHIVINTAAYTAVDQAEIEQREALNVNHLGAKNLALICEKNQIPLIHLSTDYIFNGQKLSSYMEDDEVNPINFYGKTKWLGEDAIRNTCEKHIILRVSGVFSEYGKNFLKTMLQLAKEKKVLNIVADQVICPTDANDIATILYQLVLNTQKKWGTYHFCSNDATTWYDFAHTIITEAKKHQPLTVEEVKAIPSSDYPTRAKRPSYSVLNCEKLWRDYHLAQPSWKEAVTKLVAMT